MAERILPIVVIYANPSDYPGKYVTRRQWACDDGAVRVEVDALAVVDTIEEARTAVPPETDFRLDPQPGDDPTIVECWI